MLIMLFFHCCMKIRIAMVMEIVKVLQNHIDVEIAQKPFKLT